MADTLRVENWDDFIGQERLKQRLDVHIDAAIAEGRVLDHVLLFGPPGFGKTSLATVIAGRLDVALEKQTMPLTERALKSIIQSHEGVLLLDEIHRAPQREQEGLLPLLEFNYIEDKRGIQYEAARLTIVGATTEPERVIPPLFDRFPIIPDFDDYSADEMCRIVSSMATKAGVTLSSEDALVLGEATGGTPRRARQYVLAARDLAATTGETPTAEQVLTLCRVDRTGLTAKHVEYLAALNKLGGKAGLKSLQNVLRLNEAVVRELERLLVKLGFLFYTEQGRELTNTGFKKVKQLQNG